MVGVQIQKIEKGFLPHGLWISSGLGTYKGDNAYP
jgi:hypothetical protein